MRHRHGLRYASGIFFISVAVGIASASYIGEIVYTYYHASFYIYPLLWSSILALSIYLFRLKNPYMFKAMGMRLRQSASWPIWAKAVNGLSWALPFALIVFYPADYSYLILLGIGCGNISTYLLSKRMTRIADGLKGYGCRMKREDKSEEEWEEQRNEGISGDNVNTVGREQLIVGLVSSSLLPVAVLVGSSSLLPADIMQMLSRLFIAVAYASGGIYAMSSDG
ncbi:MAG: hypothetical protein NZ888_01000 [Candidatus Nitrosocaldus sp.]|nr:hypothetical protein [Candidatus Nitrosocaldus sp.]MDW7999437.1 hypothetical protein [Candidatus Nitrosocaldus sp.]